MSSGALMPMKMRTQICTAFGHRFFNKLSVFFRVHPCSFYFQSRYHERLHANKDENEQANLARAANFVMRHA